MANFHNRARVSTATTGTGTLTLGQASTGYASFTEAGVADGQRVTYTIENGNNFEVGRGVYTASGQTLTRAQILLSKVNGEAAGTAPLSLSGTSTVFLTATAEDLRDLGPQFSVKSYGAVGDGSTNDHVAIQAAIDAADASLFIKRVYLPDPAVAYVFNDTVTIPAGVVVFGDNIKGLELSRCKPASGFTDPLFESDDYGNSRVLRIGIEGLFIDGSATTLTAIRVNAQESVFRNNTIKNCFTYGLHLGGVGSGPTEQALNNQIADNYLAGVISTTEFFDGIFIDYNSADNTIRDNYIEASKDAGIRSRGYNNKITNNHIYSVAGTGGGVGCGIYIETAADHDISQNYIESCAAEGVLVAGGGSDVATLAATISGNVFRNIDTGNTSNGVIEISGSDVSAVTVYGNVVRRDAATSYATPYFVYFNGITPTLAKVSGNSWQANLITTAETNLSLPLSDYIDLAEISEPSSPSANVSRVHARDVNSVTHLFAKDSGGRNRLLTGTAFNVLEFGVVLDGTTDDTAAFAACVAAAAGSPIYVPAGTMLLDPASYTSTLRVFGDGPSSVIKWRSAQEGLALFRFQTNALLADFCDLTIDSNHQGHSEDATFRAGIRFEAPASGTTTQLRCSNVNFINGRSHDILCVGQQVSGAWTRLRLHRCRFYDGLESTASKSAQAIRATDDVDVLITGCDGEGPTANGLGRAGFVMQQAGTSSLAQQGAVVVTGNTFRNMGYNDTDSLGAIDVYSGADNVTISGNAVIAPFGRGIGVKADQSSVSVTGNTIKGLRGADSTAAISFFSSPLAVAGISLSICGNTIEDSILDGIFVDGASTGAPIYENINVSGNVLSNVTNRNILVRNADNVNVCNNVITGGVDGILPQQGLVNVCVISGNTIKGVSNDAITSGTAQASLDLVIANNVIEAPTDRGITISAAMRNVDIHGNVIRASGGIGLALTTAPSNVWRVHDNVTIGCNSSFSLPASGGYAWGNSWDPASGFSNREVTIASGVITATLDWHWVDTEADAATDDLDTINGGVDGRIIVLYASNSSRDVVVKDATGNLQLAGDFTMTNTNDSITLHFRNSAWVELSRSDNNA